MTKKIFKILILLILLLALGNFVSGQRDLELQYPEIAGERLTTTTTLPGFIKYIFNFALVASIILVIGVLIWAGFLYLTSTGRPEQLKEAKNWLFNSCLGLGILFAAYLILATLNPQLTVIKIERLPLTQGVVLLNEKGAKNLAGDNWQNAPVDIIGNLNQRNALLNAIDNKQAKQVINISDFEMKFGKYTLTNTTGQFAKFNPVALYILPDLAGAINTHSKVITYSEKNFQGEIKEYSEEINGCGSHLCPLENFAPTSPPMSLLIKETGPGVYLYADAPYEEFLTRHSISDFRRYKFNEKSLNDNVKAISIRNALGRDYLAVLHEHVGHQGQARLFFEQRKIVNNDVGNIVPAEAETRTTEATSIYEEGEIKVESNAGFDEKNRVFIDNPNAEDFSAEITGIPGPNRLKIKHGIKATDKGVEKGALVRELPFPLAVQGSDQYGKIGSNLPSSIQVFRLSDSWSGSVTLCPATNYEPIKDKDGNIEVDCLTFSKEKNPPLTLPIWIPISIESINDKLNDNIRSISIDGNFAVVLFENFPTNNPGKVQVFTQSNPDLTGEPIGSCLARTWYIFFHFAPCTSAIAIYPLK